MNSKTIALGVAVVIGAALTLFITFGSWFTIDQGERGVLLRNGAFQKIVEPGLGFKMPFFDSVREISVRDHTFRFDKMEAYSNDQQPANLRLSITYRVTPDLVEKMYSEYGSSEVMEQRALMPRAGALAKIVFGRYTAATAIQNRAALSADTYQAIAKSLEDLPVQLVGIQMEDIAFSDVYVKSIEQRMLAQVQIETTRQQKQTSEIEAEIRIIRAKGEAEQKRQQFTAEADGIKMRGEAEATAILAKAKALAANTNLVDLNAVDRWNGVLPATMLPGAALPFIGVK